MAWRGMLLAYERCCCGASMISGWMDRCVEMLLMDELVEKTPLLDMPEW